MVLERSKCTFFIKKPMKTTKPGFHQSPIAFSEYPSNGKICIVTTFTLCLGITKTYKSIDQLIINCKTPYKAVPTSTISRWCKVILGKAGIDTENTSSHSTRSASTSKAKFQGLSLVEIKNVAGWKETSTFRRFYDKPMYKTFEDCYSIKCYG